MYGLVVIVIEFISLSGHLLNIDEMTFHFRNKFQMKTQVDRENLLMSSKNWSDS